MTFPYGQQITVVTRTPGADDGYGNPTRTETTTVVSGAFVPGPTVERVGDRDVVIDSPTVYLPTGTVVTSLDAVDIDGVRYEIDGDPLPWRSSFTGWAPGVQVRLNKATA